MVPAGNKNKRLLLVNHTTKIIHHHHHHIISIAKTTSKKIGALIRSMKSLSPEVALYLY